MDLSTIEKIYGQDYRTVPIMNSTYIITGKCSLACKYCFERGMPASKRKDMSSQVAIQGMEFLFENSKHMPNNRSISIMLFGGEPTLNPKTIISLINHYKNYMKPKYPNRNFSMNIITNCCQLSDELYNCFLENAQLINLSCQVSIDGMPEIQDLNRIQPNGKGSSHLIPDTLNKWKHIFKHDPKRLNVHGCCSPETISYLYENYCYFKDVYGISQIWFLPVPELDWKPEHVKIYDEQMNKIYHDVLNDVKKTGDVNQAFCYAPLDRFISCNFPDKPCGAGTDYCTITQDGDLFPCHQLYFCDKENETCMGNIWDGVDDDKRRIFLEYDSFDLTCPSSCDHGACYRCFASNYQNRGSMLSQIRGYYCSMMKIDQKYERMLKEELFKMGLLNGENMNHNPNCLCDSRGDQNVCHKECNGECQGECGNEYCQDGCHDCHCGSEDQHIKSQWQDKVCNSEFEIDTFTDEQGNEITIKRRKKQTNIDEAINILSQAFSEVIKLLQQR